MLSDDARKRLRKAPLNRSASKINFFMSVPVLVDGSAGIGDGVSQPGSYLELRAERDALAVLSNCRKCTTPQRLQPDVNPGGDLSAVTARLALVRAIHWLLNSAQGLRVTGERDMQGRRAELLQRIESDREVLLDFLRDFIRCPSPNPPGDTREAAAHIRWFLERYGAEYRVIAPNEIMPNIVATFEAGKPGRHLALNGHIDCEQPLKNIARPVRAYRVVTEARPAMSQASAAPPLPDKPSIAVLPFANMSGDPQQDYFADGMVEEIITALSRIRWLFVIARNSSFTYKGQSVEVKQVGRELGVRYVLEGSVRKAG